MKETKKGRIRRLERVRISLLEILEIMEKDLSQETSKLAIEQAIEKLKQEIEKLKELR